MADVTQAAAQVKNVFSSMPPAKRWTALGVGAATLVAMIALILWSQKPDYQVLFSGLSSEDAGKIVEKLKGGKVPYRLDAGGATILVPGEKVYETRLQMAGDGMLQGGAIGFEIFDTPKLGMTDFVQKLNYQRAIQGELSRTIQSLASVEKARVHIVIAKKSIFSEQEENPTASVVLKLRPGRTLTENQVTAIAQLVSSSVPGLGAERVSVIDSAGTLLSKVKPAGDSAGTAEAMGFQRGLETSLEERARAILEKTVGAGRVVVRVASEIEQKQVESTEEKYDPDMVVVRSEQRSAEKNSGSAGGAAPAGIPGTQSNVPDAQGRPAAAAVSAASGASNSSSRSNETINYEVSRTVSKSSAPVVAVKRLTIAVLVDGSYKVVKDAKGVESATYVPRTAEELASYERLVKNAVGFSQERGDLFEIVAAPFQAEDNLPASAQAGSLPAIPTSYVSVSKYLASVLLLLVLVLLVVRPLIKWISTPGPTPVPGGDLYAYAVPGAPAGSGAEGELAAGTRPPALGAAKDDIAALAQREPQRAAQAVKMWLVQG